MPWINLFKDNRKPSKGFDLKFSSPSSEDVVLLDEDDFQHLEKVWGHSLIGYVVGRFPGKKALLECCQKWGVKFSYSTHENGWLVFKFDSDDMNHVLSAGPYFIFQRPLLLKVMPLFFDFANEELSKIPVWVKLRNLPLELWNPQALGKNLSKIGSPIHTDRLIAFKGSISFARALVEVDASLDLIEEVHCKLPTVKQDNKTTTSEGPTAGSPTVQSQDAEVVAFTETNPNNPFGKSKEDQVGLSTQPCMMQPQATDNIPALQTPFDISGVENSKIRVGERSFSQNKKPYWGGSFSSKPMIIASWNIIGFNLPLKHHAMQNSFITRELIFEIGISLTTSLLTMLVGFSSFGNLIKLLYRSCNPLLSKQFQVSYIYSLHSVMAISNISAFLNCPWLLIGDFNSILSPKDRFNGVDISAYEMQDFFDCYSELGLGNLNSHRSMYTWTNGRVWSKLDRALCNQLWLNSFENSSCEVVGFESISDHAPLVVTTKVLVPKGNSPFKFNNAIVDHPNFLSIVSDGRSHQVPGCCMFKVCKRLKTLKSPLKLLFKQEFSHIANRVEQAEAEYSRLLNSLQ
ncbi:hypothetical protein GmHk_13G036174 [Glycine max]|nr:hypothetical protein GmHk_13G036174 [Glycine max]